MKFVGDLKILKKEFLTDDVFRMVLENHKNSNIQPGQFYNIEVNKTLSPMLKRPISVATFNDSEIEFLVKVVGEGTKLLSEFEVGDSINVMGPLGHGYEKKDDYKKALFLGAGIGVAPIKQMLAEFEGEKTTIVGFRDEPYDVSSFQSLSDQVFTVSENSEADYKGYVTDVLKEKLDTTYDVVYACGPDIVLHMTRDICAEKGVEVQLLMESKMACGIGACLVCTCKVKSESNPLDYEHVRTCKEGPMFYGDEVIFDA